MLIDHMALVVSDYDRTKAFYKAALAPLGVDLITEVEGAAGFGRDGNPEFWVVGEGEPQCPMHFAFSARDEAEVQAFFDAALAAGGKSDGGPQRRELYGFSVFGAFVIDPDGHRIEACLGNRPVIS